MSEARIESDAARDCGDTADRGETGADCHDGREGLGGGERIKPVGESSPEERDEGVGHTVGRRKHADAGGGDAVIAIANEGGFREVYSAVWNLTTLTESASFDGYTQTVSILKVRNHKSKHE